MTEEHKITPQEYWKDFPEAPASDTSRWIDSSGFEHMTTIRSWSVEGLDQQVTKFYTQVSVEGGKPANSIPPAPATTAPARDEHGTPIVDGNTGEPVMAPLPEGVHLFTVAGLFHGQTQSGQDFLGVRTVEKPYSSKWGAKCFEASNVPGWKSWPLSDKEPVVYAPPDQCKHVLIRDPQGNSKYPTVLELRA